jgi:hypothetical protein
MFFAVPALRVGGPVNMEDSNVSNQITGFIDNIPEGQWEVYNCVLTGLSRSGLSFALGGAIAYAGYTGRMRNTKDLDIYVVPEDRDRAVEMLSACGLQDYFDELPYDRSWIYRGKKNEAIMDIIFAMANGRSRVTRDWLCRGPVIEARNQRFRIIPPEELIWSKLYVVQRERCDWPDVLNVVDAAGPSLDWNHLLALLEDDRPLLRSLMSVYSWITPDGAARLPRWLWPKLDLPAPAASEHAERMHLLDTRPWFGKAA